MNSNKNFKRKISKLNDEELLSLIDEYNNSNGLEIFLIKREFKIREHINYNSKNPTANNLKPRKIRIPFYLKVDFKSLFITLSALIFCVIFVWFQFYYTPKINYNDYNISTYGKIHSIKENTGFSHSADGTSVVTSSYTINYSYYGTDSTYYTNSEIILNKNINYPIITYLNNKLENDYIPIRFKAKKPKESIINRRVISK